MEEEHKRKVVVLMAQSIIQTCCAAYAVEEEEQRAKRQRSCWVKPWRESRAFCGNITNLLKEYQLFEDKQAFKGFLCMDENAFGELLSFVGKSIERCDTKMRKCIPVEVKLAATLRFLGTGESFKELAKNTKLSLPYVSASIMEVCSAIYTNVGPSFLKFPTTNTEWLRIANDYEEVWQFPNCLGALDGKHIAMTPAKDNANLFHNYKGFHSIVLLAVADAFGKFLFIDVGCNGRISDGGVLSRSILSSILDNDENFPNDKIIGNQRKLPYVLVADNAFPLGKHIVTPYNRKNLVKDEIIFNQRLSRARQNIERAFGMLSKRFRILQKTIPLGAEKTKIIVQAACVLHNFLMQRSELYRQGLEDLQIEPDQPAPENNSNTNLNGANIRNEFKLFFCSEDQM